MIVTTVNKFIAQDKLKDAIIFLVGQCVNSLSIFKPNAILFQATYTRYNRDHVDGINRDSELNQLAIQVIRFANELEKFEYHLEPANDERVLSKTLLFNDSFPFVDRKEFRKQIAKALTSENSDVIFVEGESKTGMSYLEKFLNEITRKLDKILLVPLEMPAVLGMPDIIQGEKLAKSLLNKLGVSIKFDQEENEQFKFTQFFNCFKEEIKSTNKIPIFFLHDFHKIEHSNENLLEFIFYLLKNRHHNDFPKCIFVLAGFNYNNIRLWANEFRFTTEVYKIEPISQEDIEICLSKIFKKYSPRIKALLEEEITEEKYIEGMIKKLVGDEEKINIPNLGLRMTEHLYSLKM